MFPKLKDIRLHRKSLDMSQTELADAVGITQGTIAKIERGKMVPNYRMAKRIFEVLNARSNAEGVRADRVMIREIVTLEPEELVEEAVKKMSKKGISTLPVVENGSVIGRVTEKRLLKAGRESYGKPCRSIMGPPLASVTGSTPLSTVRDILKSEQLVAIIGEEGKLRGILSRSDVL